MSKPSKGYHWRYVIEKPDPFKPAKMVNHFCHQMSIQGGELVRCMAETEGHTYCPECTAKRERVPTGRRYMKYWGVA